MTPKQSKNNGYSLVNRYIRTEQSTGQEGKSGNFKNVCLWDLSVDLRYMYIPGLLDFELDVRNTPPNLDPRLSLQAEGRESVIQDVRLPKCFWDFAHADGCQQIRKFKKLLLNQ